MGLLPFWCWLHVTEICVDAANRCIGQLYSRSWQPSSRGAEPRALRMGRLALGRPIQCSRCQFGLQLTCSCWWPTRHLKILAYGYEYVNPHVERQHAVMVTKVPKRHSCRFSVVFFLLFPPQQVPTIALNGARLPYCWIAEICPPLCCAFKLQLKKISCMVHRNLDGRDVLDRSVALKFTAESCMTCSTKESGWSWGKVGALFCTSTHYKHAKGSCGRPCH